VEFSSSLKVTEALKKAILKQSFEYAGDVVDDQMKAKDDVRKHKQELGKQAADSVKHELSGSLRRAMDLAQERGASTWLTTQPIQEFGFTLHNFRVPSKMPWLFATTGKFLVSPLLVPVVQNSRSNTLYHVPEEDSPPFDTTKYRM